jgi:hypothetical protein
MEKVGRNDPCPCGSGKKFKKCCEMNKPKGLQTRILPVVQNAQEASKTASLFFKRSIQPIPPKDQPPS